MQRRYDGDEPSYWGAEDAEECAWQATRCGGGKAMEHML